MTSACAGVVIGCVVKGTGVVVAALVSTSGASVVVSKTATVVSTAATVVISPVVTTSGTDVVSVSSTAVTISNKIAPQIITKINDAFMFYKCLQLFDNHSSAAFTQLVK